MAPGQIVPLSDLTPASKRARICVRISRMWNYFTRGKQLGHLDLVLIDEMGGTIYAEIAGSQAPQFKDLLVEGEVYLIWDFFVQSAKNMFRPVQGKFMIRTTPWTKIEQKSVVPPNFPRYAYSLTSFDVLPRLIGKKESFLDTVGIIVGISDLLIVRLPGQTDESYKRNLRLVDIDGKKIDVALWGQHAMSFDGEELYKKAQLEVLIILLVGTLMKDYRGHETISCGDAGKYCINPDIPEVAAYCERLGKQLPVVEWMSAADDRYQKAYKQTEAKAVDVQTLLATDPNDFIGQNLVCTVTLTKVKSPSWWFLACSRCHRTAHSAGTEFACSDPSCSSITAEPRYKVCMLGTDGTGEAEFVFFAGLAERIIGKHVDALIRAATHRPSAIPAEISALVTQKYTLNVSIAKKGLQFGYVAFQVNNIDAIHPKAKTFEFNTLISTANQLVASDSAGGTSMSIPPTIELSNTADIHSPQTCATANVDVVTTSAHSSSISLQMIAIANSTETALPGICQLQQIDSITTSTDTSSSLVKTTPPPLRSNSIDKEPTEALKDVGSATKSTAVKRPLYEKTKDPPRKRLFD